MNSFTENIQVDWGQTIEHPFTAFELGRNCCPGARGGQEPFIGERLVQPLLERTVHHQSALIDPFVGRQRIIPL